MFEGKERQLNEETIRQIIRHKESTIALFGESGKQKRERLILKAFFRCLGLRFDPLKINSIDDTFPDVEFKGAKFEVKEMMDRKRHDEYKKSLEKFRKTKSLRSQIEDYDPIFLSFNKIGQKIKEFIESKCSKYAEEQRASTNLLIYFNLQDVMLDTEKECGRIALDKNGWRSVSVVGSSWCYVFDSATQAPKFIMENVRRFYRNSGLWE